MGCEQGKRWLDEYLAENVTAEQKQQCEEHLETCRACRQEVADYRRTVDFLASVALPSMSDTFWQRQRMSIVRAIRPQPVWKAPALSLVLFASVLAGYLYAGLDWLVISAGDYLGLTGANVQNLAPHSFDAYDTVILLYIGLFSLALMVFLSDSDEQRPMSQRRNM